MNLKYAKIPIEQHEITDWPQFPFVFSDKIEPIKLEGMTLKPDMHCFDVCFAQMERSYPNIQTSVEHLDEGIQVSEDESLLYLGINPHVFLYSDGIERRITDSQICEIPNIIERFMNESGFKDLITKAKKHLVTYGDETTGNPYHDLNGIGLIISQEGNFTQNCISPFQSRFLDKFFEIKGVFIGGDVVKGLDYHLSLKKYKELLE